MQRLPIRIILVDDHKLLLKTWRMLLSNNEIFQVVAECENGNDAIEEAERLVPDIMLIDINMKPLNGFEVTEAIMKKLPSIKIMGLSVNNQPKYASRMLELGARGYITKTSPPEEIKHGISEVHKGEIYVCDEIKMKMPIY